ncbi:MAG TPA: nuclear transport factor 2 family protein [Solirubrobacteraceae bacterium]|nr:nuclear transport factor 2 family protein [Solirubrobacteraceae bacterium]HTX10480.1 nuclear transport factor 2 family protein [Solirubrobacteraceae bacterium]
MSDELLARVAALEAERDILRTMYSYGHAIDRGDTQGWIDCFTEDGVFAASSERPGYPPFHVEGRAALTDFHEQHTRPPGLWHKHLVIEPLIDVDGEQADVTSYFVVLVEHDGRPTVRVFGRYTDHLRRDPDGRWRFAERRSSIESVAPGLPPLAYGRERAERALEDAERSQK